MAGQHGGRRPGAGRPKGSFRQNIEDRTLLKSARIVLACTEAEAAQIKQQAADAGKTVSRYLVELALSS